MVISASRIYQWFLHGYQYFWMVMCLSNVSIDSMHDYNTHAVT